MRSGQNRSSQPHPRLPRVMGSISLELPVLALAASSLIVLAVPALFLVLHPQSPSALLGLLIALLLLVSGGLCLTLLHERQAHSRASERLTQIENLLCAHPALTLILNASGQALAAYGAAPVALNLDALFQSGLLGQIHSPDRPTVQAALKRAYQGTETSVRLTPAMAMDQRLLMVVRPLTASPAATPGSPMRLIAVILDATVQHAREENLIAARSEAEAQNASKSLVLANVSHELRTPLNAVLGFSEIMTQGLFGPLPDRYGDYAQSIHDAGHHLLDLIGDLLDVSRIEAARYDLNLEPFDVREVIASAVSLVRLAAEDKGVTLAAILPPQPIPVCADRRAIKQITVNLLSNAVKFTPTGGQVTVAAAPVGSEMELLVSDTGLGISADDLTRLGRRYEQAGEADQKAQGTGLGLSLVRALTELHKGQMILDSTPGVGTSVRIRLPIMDAKNPGDSPSQEAKIIPLSRKRR